MSRRVLSQSISFLSGAELPIPSCETFIGSWRSKIRSIIGSGAEGRLFVRQVSATSGVRVVLIAIGVVTSVMTARMLGPAGRGLYSAAIVLGAIGSQFGNLGLHAANTYYLGRDRSLLPRLLSNALCIAFGVGGGVALTLWAIFKVYPALSPVGGALLTSSLLLIPVGLVGLLLQNLLLGVREVKWYNIVEVINRGGFVAALGSAWLLMRGVVAWEVLLFFLLAACISAAVAGGRLLYITSGLPLPSFTLLRAQATYGLRSYLTCLAGYIVLKSDILLVKDLAGDTAAGLYSLASNMTDFVYTFPTVVGMILFPLLASTGQIEARWRRVRRTMAGVSVILSGIAITAAICAHPMVALAFGNQFLPAVPAFLILCIAIVFYGANSVISIFFSSCGQPWFSVWIWVAGGLLNIGINLVVIPRWGIVGAAISSLITYIALFVVQYRVALRFVREKAFEENHSFAHVGDSGTYADKLHS